MYLILSALFFQLYSQNTTVQQNYNSSKHYKVHTNEDKVIISLPDAIDAHLILQSEKGSCNLHQKNIQLLNKNIQMIDENEFTGKDYSDGTPFNFREFICMTQVKDGIIALTTDLYLYLFLFDYEAIYQTNNNNFAKISWKADLQALLGDEEKYEFAQIISLTATESALVIFKDLAYQFSVKEMKKISTSIEISTVGDWITRDERGLTKYYEGLIFSSVGQEGLDIYQENLSSLQFLSNLNKYRLALDDFNLKDFTVYQLPDLKFRLFCLVVNGDIFVIDIYQQEYTLNFEIKFQIKSKGSGVAIDTKNGQNIFVVYQKTHIYEVNELWVPADNYPNYIILDSFTTKSQIKDVDATDEFAILQGQSHHKILFSDRQFKQNSNYSDLPTFIQYGMRDFEFFKLTPNSIYIDEDDEYEPDDFFFGITANKIILSQFKVQPIQIKCFSEKPQENQYYQLTYNTSIMVEIQEQFYEKITQNIYNFTVEYTTTYIFETELIRLELLFSGLFIISTFLSILWIYQKRQTISLLEKELKNHQRKQSSVLTQAIQFQTPFAEVGKLVQKN